MRWRPRYPYRVEAGQRQHPRSPLVRSAGRDRGAEAGCEAVGADQDPEPAAVDERQAREVERDLETGETTPPRRELKIDDLDVLMMRNDPVRRRRRSAVGGDLGRAVRPARAARGVLVANDPFSLANALNKTYFQHFPESVRPRTLISRDPDTITEFVAEVGGRAVLKPLQGSGGSGVFLVPTRSPRTSTRSSRRSRGTATSSHRSICPARTTATCASS